MHGDFAEMKVLLRRVANLSPRQRVLCAARARVKDGLLFIAAVKKALALACRSAAAQGRVPMVLLLASAGFTAAESSRGALTLGRLRPEAPWWRFHC